MRRRLLRDRAIVYVRLSTGLRREELVNLDLDQLVLATPTALRTARQARITHVRGKINGLNRITEEVVQAPCESLVIGHM